MTRRPTEPAEAPGRATAEGGGGGGGHRRGRDSEWRAEARRILSFAVVGTLGFVVDTAVLYAGIGWGLGLRWGRVLSYLVAVTTTWALNRRFTFVAANEGSALAQWARFALTQLGGAAVNLSTYYALIGRTRVAAHFPVLAVAAGSLAGLALNYLLARLYVFVRLPAERAPSVSS